MSRRGERKFTEFKWEKEGMKLLVPVWIIDTSKRDPHSIYQTEGPTIYFRARLEEPYINEEDPDINELKEKVFKELDAWYNVKWELYVVVTAQKSPAYPEGGMSVSFTYEYYVIGERQDGKTVHMDVPEPDTANEEDYDGSWPGVQWSGRIPREGLPSTEEPKYPQGNARTERALIRATPDNIRAIKRFQEALGDLADQMRHHFHQDNIEDVLGRILTLPEPIRMLPSGEEEP